jgi:hypothetical protein
MTCKLNVHGEAENADTFYVLVVLNVVIWVVM